MKQPEDHHSVPQFYLSYWTRGPKNELWEFRNFGGKISRREIAPARTAYVPHLYSYSEEYKAANRAEIETNFFSPLDDKGAKILAKFLSGEELAQEERTIWAQFISGLRVRTPQNIKKLKDHATDYFTNVLDAGNEEYKALKADTDPAEFKDWVALKKPALIENIGVGQIPKVVSSPQVLTDILKMSWYSVDLSRASKRLLTSDQPCIFTGGLQHKDTFIALPLTPTRAFFAFYNDSKAKSHIMQTPVSRLVNAMNVSVVSQAYERVYSMYDIPDNFLLKYLKLSQPQSKAPKKTA